MSKKKNQPNESGFEQVEQALTKTEQYVEENKKSLTIIVLAIAVVLAGYLSYKNLYLEPKEKLAQEEIFHAEKYFEIDSFDLALHGDGNTKGLLDIIDEYGVTNTANLAYYRAGVCYLRLGEYETAIEYLKQFDSNDKLVQVVALGCIGDAYVELGEYDQAISFYKKAAATNPNELTSVIYLKKLGLVYEEQEEFAKAIEAYEQIKTKYPNSNEARNIQKRISAAEMRM